MIKRITKIFAVVLGVFTFFACSDNSTGPDAEPPSVPDMQHVEMDLSVFDLSGSFHQVDEAGELNTFNSIFSEMNHI